MEPGVVRLIERTAALAVGTTESVEVVAGFRFNIPFENTGIVGY
jgi:hypothetical protein